MSGRTFALLGAVIALIAIFATDQVVPATSAHQAELRIWLAARAAGFVTLGLLTFQVVLGLVLSRRALESPLRLTMAGAAVTGAAELDDEA